MRNFILSVVALISFNASAQHIPGLKTISTFFDLRGKLTTMIVMGQTHRPLTSYTMTPSFNAPIFVDGTMIEAGKMYILNISDGNIVGIKPFGKKENSEENMKVLNSVVSPEGVWYNMDLEGEEGKTVYIDFMLIDFENRTVTIDGELYYYGISETGNILALRKEGETYAYLYQRIG